MYKTSQVSGKKLSEIHSHTRPLEDSKTKDDIKNRTKHTTFQRRNNRQCTIILGALKSNQKSGNGGNNPILRISNQGPHRNKSKDKDNKDKENKDQTVKILFPQKTCYITNWYIFRNGQIYNMYNNF
jgi:hypothetical protein